MAPLPSPGGRPWDDLVPLASCAECGAIGSVDVRRDAPDTSGLVVVDRSADVLLRAERQYQAALARGRHVTRVVNRLREARAEAARLARSPERYTHAGCPGVVRFFDTHPTQAPARAAN